MYYKSYIDMLAKYLNEFKQYTEEEKEDVASYFAHLIVESTTCAKYYEQILNSVCPDWKEHTDTFDFTKMVCEEEKKLFDKVVVKKGEELI